MWGILGKVLPVLGFVDQATSKERASYDSLPTMERLQAMFNNVTGNAFGLNFFGGTIPKFTAKFNPAGIANKYTGIGVAGILLGLLNRNLPKGARVPYLGRISSLAKRFLPAGIVGGIIDAPNGNNYSTTPAPSISYHNRETVSSFGS